VHSQLVLDTASGVNGGFSFKLSIRPTPYIHANVCVMVGERAAIDDGRRVGDFDGVAEFMPERRELIKHDTAARDLDDHVSSFMCAAHERQLSHASVGKPTDIDVDHEVGCLETIEKTADQRGASAAHRDKLTRSGAQRSNVR
jgi:hypothetical protein